MHATNGDDPDKIHMRSSPSFNDSEPPSYFEAIGISHPAAVNLNTDIPSSHELHRMPKASSNKEFATTQQPNHQRHHVIRTQNLQPSLYPSQQARYNFSYCSSNTNNTLDNTASSHQKPSETYMVWSVFTTVYCVFIGVVALVLSIKVHHYNKQGDFRRAYARSKLARNINIAGLFFGFIYMGIGLLACFLPIR